MENMPTRTTPPLLMVAGAFATVYLIWGSTYLAIRFAVETLPPFLMAGVRFLLAGILLYAVMRARDCSRPTLGNWKAAGVVGTLLLFGGNGLVCWAEQHVPSGLAALLIATVPLWMVLFDWLLHRGTKPTWRIVAGLVVGLIGVAILLGPSGLGGSDVHLYGALALLSACVFWSIGSLYSRKADLPNSPFLATAMEMLAGGAVLLLVGTLAGEWSRVDFDAISTKSILSLAYLCVFGSIFALTAYTWLLRVTTPAKVSTYAYVNPVVAMGLGYVLANEPLSPRVLVAATVILGAVVLITTTKQRQTPSPSTESHSNAPTDNACASEHRNRKSTREPPEDHEPCLSGSCEGI